VACRPRPCRLSPRLPGRSRSRNREGRLEHWGNPRRAGTSGSRSTPPWGPRTTTCRSHRPKRTVRALGALGRQGAAARARALPRPEGRPALRERQRPRPAPAPARAGRGGAPPQAPPARGFGVYELTEWGLELEPVLVSPGCWGHPRDRMPGKRCNKTSW
jgi:hypothetical protein